MTKIEEYKQRFFDSSIADILRAIDGRSLVGAFVLTLSSIAALSEVYRCADYVDDPTVIDRIAKLPPVVRGFLIRRVLPKLPRKLRDFLAKPVTPKHSASSIYRNWVKTWFKKAGVNKPHEGYLYAVRCGLAHIYGLSDELEREGNDRCSFRHNQPALHWAKRTNPLKSGLNPGYVINLETLVAQYVVAAFLFFDEMSKLAGTDADTVLKRLEKQIDIYDPDDSGNATKRIEAPKTYAQMHASLADCDSGKPSVANIQKSIQGLY